MVALRSERSVSSAEADSSSKINGLDAGLKACSTRNLSRREFFGSQWLLSEFDLLGQVFRIVEEVDQPVAIVDLQLQDPQHVEAEDA